MNAIRDMELKLDQSLSEQKSFRSSIEKRLQNMHKSINETITAECKSVRDYLKIDIQMLSDRVDGVHSRLKAIKTDLEKEIAGLKTRIENLETANESFCSFSPEITIVATGIQYAEDEDLLEKTKWFVGDGLELDIPVVNTMRTPHHNGWPRIVKIQYESKEDNIKALKEKKAKG